MVYNFKCPKCENIIEVRQKVSETGPILVHHCETCQEETEHLKVILGSPVIVFKGNFH